MQRFQTLLWFPLKSAYASSGHHRRIADVVGGHADGSHLQCLDIDADVQLAPLTPRFGSVLFTLPFTFAQELDTCRVK